MRILIRRSEGSFRSAMLLAVIGDRLRVALPGADDITEYLRAGEQWWDENGAVVEIEFQAVEGPLELDWRVGSQARPDRASHTTGSVSAPSTDPMSSRYIN